MSTCMYMQCSLPGRHTLHEDWNALFGGILYFCAHGGGGGVCVCVCLSPCVCVCESVSERVCLSLSPCVPVSVCVVWSGLVFLREQSLKICDVTHTDHFHPRRGGECSPGT